MVATRTEPDHALLGDVRFGQSDRVMDGTVQDSLVLNDRRSYRTQLRRRSGHPSWGHKGNLGLVLLLHYPRLGSRGQASLDQTQ